MDPNPGRAEPEWPAVVVAGAYLTGVVLMRNLVRRGLTACCVDHSAEEPGFRTVYGRAHLCPNPDEKPDDWVEFMIALATKIGGKPVLMSSADQFVKAVSAHAERLNDHFVFCRTSVATQALLATKRCQYDLAAAHGMPVPRTQFVRSLEQAMAFGVEARFPCLLKPVHFLDWERVPATHPLYCQKVALVPARDKLEATYRLAAEASPELVIQEIIEGPDTEKLVYLSCYDRSSRRIGACMLRQFRTWPIHFGSASVVEPVSDPEADGLCDTFLRALGYVGLCEIELKRDTRDGRVKMIEANPRYSVTADAAPYAGVDLGWLHYLDLIGKTVLPVNPEQRNFRHIVLERDFATIGAYRREQLLGWRDVIRSYWPPVVFFDFDLRDWRVTGATVYKLARFVAGRLIRRIYPKWRRRPA